MLPGEKWCLTTPFRGHPSVKLTFSGLRRCKGFGWKLVRHHNLQQERKYIPWVGSYRTAAWTCNSMIWFPHVLKQSDVFRTFCVCPSLCVRRCIHDDFLLSVSAIWLNTLGMRRHAKFSSCPATLVQIRDELIKVVKTISLTKSLLSPRLKAYLHPWRNI